MKEIRVFLLKIDCCVWRRKYELHSYRWFPSNWADVPFENENMKNINVLQSCLKVSSRTIARRAWKIYLYLIPMRRAYTTTSNIHSENESERKQCTVNRVILRTERTTKLCSPRAFLDFFIFMIFIMSAVLPFIFCDSVYLLSALMCSVEEWLFRHRVSAHGQSCFATNVRVSIWEISWKRHKTFNNWSFNFGTVLHR